MSFRRIIVIGSLAVLALLGPANADGAPAQPALASLELPAIEPAALLARDAARDRLADPGPLRFAEPTDLELTPAMHGRWTESPDGGRTWELIVNSPGATDLNFGFDRFDLPPGATLTIATPDESSRLGPYGPDAAFEGQLWTALLPGSIAILRLALPPDAPEPDIQLARVSSGYRDILDLRRGPQALPKSGACNIDVICPDGDPWRDEIRSVAWYTLEGFDTCTATLVMDVPRTFRPFMLSANHCGVTGTNAGSIVLYWNDEVTVCRGPRNGAASAITQSGATFRASLRAPDFLLFEMAAAPPAAANAYWAGWDATDAVPLASVPIHHPNLDEKAISFDDDPLTKGDSCIGPGTDTHWYVGQYERGTTEPGSSGCGLWDAATHRIVGTLSGGAASCTFIDYDCYGRFARSWSMGTSPAARLRDWLDPGGTGALTSTGGRPGGSSSIRLDSVAIQDACSLGLGDGNGFAEPGETVTLIPRLLASGSSFTSVTGTLTGPAPVTILDGNAAWPDLSPGTPRDSDAPHLQISIASTAACGTILNLNLRVTTASGGPFDLPIALTVGEPGPVPNVPVSIPDLSTGTSTVTITNDVVLSDVKVRVVINHPWVGDLRLRLQSPLGSRVTLLDRPGVPATAGGCDNSNMDVTFDDASAFDPESYCAGFNPWYQGVARPTVPLSLFDGERSAGTWSLIAEDLAAGDVGVIANWELITTPPVGGRCVACAACPGQEIAKTVPNVLRVTKQAGGQVALTFPGALSACATGVQVRMSPSARPLVEPGSFPDDPPFADVTAQDVDPGPRFVHVPPAGNQHYLVVEDLAGIPGPSGSY